MLKQRIITALVLVFGLLALLFAAPDSVVSIAFVVIAALAAWEWAGLLGFSAIGRWVYGALFLGVALLVQWGAWGLMPVAWCISALFWIIVAPFWLVRGWRLTAAGPVLGAILGIFLLLATWGALVSLFQLGPWKMLAVLAAVWVADIAAYFAGRRWGRVKLAPAISPGKTREGAYGALVAVTVYGLVIGPATGLWVAPSGMSVLAVVALLLLVTVISIFGDLFESLLKRQAGIKDSSQLLPGHGGILDRIDSQISTLPLVALVMSLSA